MLIREEIDDNAMVYINVCKGSDLEYRVEKNWWIVNVENGVKSGILIPIPNRPKSEVV
jgi:hypothetical protein